VSGSHDTLSPWSADGGRVFSTALAAQIWPSPTAHFWEEREPVPDENDSEREKDAEVDLDLHADDEDDSDFDIDLELEKGEL